ncbi:uncharacterized protein dnajc14 [Trichomycterus rosablanca]|uniref:uncharacterized protein dnajc14 n=1 Tax=Trichomycterus rosablanca TaxID=2290929 RepID=UPI002F35E55D
MDVMDDHVDDCLEIDQTCEETDGGPSSAFGQTLDLNSVGVAREELEGSNSSHGGVEREDLWCPKEKTEDGEYTRTNGRTGQPEDDGNSVFDEIDDEKDGRNSDDWKDLKGESGSRRKGKSRKSGSGSADQFWTTPTSFSYKSCLSSSGAPRHKQIRRRNHHNQGRFRRQTGFQLATAVRDFLSDSVSPWSIFCIHMVVDLIVSLTHRCGVIVESTAIALYDFGSLLLHRITDVPGMKQDLKRVTDFTRNSGAAFVFWAGRSVSSVRRAVVSGLGLLTAVVCACARVARAALERLGGERGRRWWLSLRNCRVVSAVSAFFGGIRIPWFWKRGSTGATATPESPSRTERSQPGQELERLLALAQVPEDELDPFSVLGVNTFATEAELKRAYRQLAVQVHPDKNKHPRAGEAFKVLRAAWDIVSNPETRREYELKRMAASELSKSMNEFLTKLQDDLKEAMNTMMCTKCEGKHKRFEMDREPHEARFCADCNKRHGAEEGDLWAESSMLGLKITYFAFMDGKVYDITEWAGCQRIGISPDTHRVPYHISFGAKSNSGSTRQRSPSSPPPPPPPGSPSDLHDFFSRIFQGAPGGDASSNGGFFPPGSSPHHPGNSGAGPPPPPPPPQPGFFPPRGEPGEGWSDGGKNPRRRKKARKPFQR